MLGFKKSWGQHGSRKRRHTLGSIRIGIRADRLIGLLRHGNRDGNDIQDDDYQSRNNGRHPRGSSARARTAIGVLAPRGLIGFEVDGVLALHRFDSRTNGFRGQPNDRIRAGL